jgi:hypothetical protein
VWAEPGELFVCEALTRADFRKEAEQQRYRDATVVLVMRDDIGDIKLARLTQVDFIKLFKKSASIPCQPQHASRLSLNRRALLLNLSACCMTGARFGAAGHARHQLQALRCGRRCRGGRRRGGPKRCRHRPRGLRGCAASRGRSHAHAAGLGTQQPPF